MLRHARGALPARIRLEAVLVGDGPLRQALQRYLDHHGMSDWVRLTGAADHARIARIYADADFYVAPAHLESFGIAALEARSAGLPVIAHAHSGIADFITDRVDGLLTRDDADMTARIAELASDPAGLANLARACAQVAPVITWARVLRQCDALYEQARHGAAVERPAGVDAVPVR
jgi:glycosyltransferase involved in cell wall biosynthesis